MKTDATPRLKLAAAHRHELQAAAEAAYPDEYCALLIGIDEGEASFRVTRIVHAANVHAEPRTGFEVDPRVLIGVLRDLREAARIQGEPVERLLGHAHSHPDGPARPSARDLGLAHEPGLVWMIMSVCAGTLEDIKSFLAVRTDGSGVEFHLVDVDS